MSNATALRSNVNVSIPRAGRTLSIADVNATLALSPMQHTFNRNPRSARLDMVMADHLADLIDAALEQCKLEVEVDAAFDAILA